MPNLTKATEAVAYYKILDGSTASRKEGTIVAGMFKGAHNVYTPRLLVEEILDILNSRGHLQGRILVMFNVEFVISLIYTYNIAPENITFYSDHDKKSKICSKSGVKYIITSLKKKHMKKFDTVIINPPYQDKKGNEGSTNSADLYTKFVYKALELSKKYVAMIVPSAWTGPKHSMLKKVIFEDNQPFVFNTHGKKWFRNVEMNTCYFITEVGRKGPTVISDAFENTITMTLNKSASLSVNLSMMSLKDKISSFAKNNNFGSRWIRGKLHLNQVEENLGEEVEFIKAVGRKDANLEIVSLKIGVEDTGYGINKLVIPNMGGSSSIGHIKIAKKNQVGGHSVVFLTANNKNELPHMKSYLESKIIRFLIDAVKISTPNSKTLFTFIPVIDFTRSWTDIELYQYFGLTQEEIDYIEANVK